MPKNKKHNAIQGIKNLSLILDQIKINQIRSTYFIQVMYNTSVLLDKLQTFEVNNHVAILAGYAVLLSFIEFKTLKGFKYTLRLLPWLFLNEFLVNKYVVSIFDTGLNIFQDRRVFSKVPMFSNSILNFVLTFFLFEFMTYVVHCCFHRNEYLWNLHKVHHNTSEMTWSLTFKSHFLENLLFLLPPFVLVYFFDVHLLSLWLYQSLSFFWGVFVHSKSDRVMPDFVEKYLNTIKAHHWHHYKSTIHNGGQNFGNLSLIFDIIFKTKHNPKDYPTEVGMSDYEVLNISLKDELLNPLISNYKKMIS